MSTHTHMKKLILFCCLSILSGGIYSQVKKASASKNGYAKVMKVTPDKSLPLDEARVIFTFIGPDNKPATKLIKVHCNYDSAFPAINAAGNYTVEFDPGKYKMKFQAPYWHPLKTDSIPLKKQTTSHITVKFEAMEISK